MLQCDVLTIFAAAICTLAHRVTALNTWTSIWRGFVIFQKSYHMQTDSQRSRSHKHDFYTSHWTAIKKNMPWSPSKQIDTSLSKSLATKLCQKSTTKRLLLIYHCYLHSSVFSSVSMSSFVLKLVPLHNKTNPFTITWQLMARFSLQRHSESTAGIAPSSLSPSGCCDRCSVFLPSLLCRTSFLCSSPQLATWATALESWRTQCQLGHRWTEHEVTNISGRGRGEEKKSAAQWWNWRLTGLKEKQ